MRFVVLLALLAAGCAMGCAATNGGGAVPVRLRPLGLPIVAPAATTVSWTMPRYHANAGGAPDTTKPLAMRLRLWELAYTTKAKACRDSGLAWCRDTANFKVWIPQAGNYFIIAEGYALPGESVAVAEPPVMSLQWPYTWWVRSWTYRASMWSNPVTRAGQ